MPSDVEDENEEESPTPVSEDLSQGYQLRISVTPQGFTVSDPEPLAPAPSEEVAPAPSEEGAPSPDLSAAKAKTEEILPDRVGLVKALIGVLEANPMGEDEMGQMRAGYGPAE